MDRAVHPRLPTTTDTHDLTTRRNGTTPNSSVEPPGSEAGRSPTPTQPTTTLSEPTRFRPCPSVDRG
jgi:hypothetical protein